jgi:uncharacterized protein
MKGRQSERILKQYASTFSRSDFSREAAVNSPQSKLTLRSAGKIGALWRGLDGVWRDELDRRINITQKTRTGAFFNLLEPDPETFTDEDLALGLSREHRWNGQTLGEFGYSVAQHSIAMVVLLRSRLRTKNELALLYALLHDAEEGLGIKDTITGLKIVLGATYIEIANSISEAIHIKYGLSYPPPSAFLRAIKKADAVLGMTEAIHLMNFTEDSYRKRIQNSKLRPVRDGTFIKEYIIPWRPREAEMRFLEVLNELRN